MLKVRFTSFECCDNNVFNTFILGKLDTKVFTWHEELHSLIYCGISFTLPRGPMLKLLATAWVDKSFLFAG